MKQNENLPKQIKKTNDEFYTQLKDIEKELINYKKHFQDKIVYCNCDDPEWSNFFIYLRDNFNNLSLKKLITTHYSPIGNSYKLELNNQGETIKTDLKGNGDFRSEECIEILKETDLVISNPPFSLFREYTDLLMQYDKKFLIIGPFNSLSFKNMFQYVKNNELWLGVNPRSMDFILPNGDAKTVNAGWFTNLTHNKQKNKIILHKLYKGNENNYPKYDNYDAINVDRVNNIPADYIGYIGVPISFLDKFNPDQFEIIRVRKGSDNKDLSINGKFPYSRVIIKTKY